MHDFYSLLTQAEIVNCNYNIIQYIYIYIYIYIYMYVYIYVHSIYR